MTAENILAVASGTLIVAALFVMVVLNVKLRSSIANLVKENNRYSNDQMMFLDEIAKLQDEIDSLRILESDGFIKFLSDSRQWAFDFIDEFQSTLIGLENALQAADSEKILEEFNKLKRFLPETK